MAKALTSEQLFARFQAFDEAAEHLQLDWSDDPLEREQGLIASQQIRLLADKAKVKAHKALRREEAAAKQKLQKAGHE